MQQYSYGMDAHACAGVCRVTAICRLKYFVSIGVLIILLTQSPHISVWYGACINTVSLMAIQLFPFFPTFYVLNGIIPSTFRIVKTSHNNFSQNRSWLLQDDIAQYVLHQRPTIFFYSSMTLRLLIPFKRCVLDCIHCLYLFTVPHRQYLTCSLDRKGRKFLLAMLD